jgi:hypothetical protein
MLYRRRGTSELKTKNRESIATGQSIFIWKFRHSGGQTRGRTRERSNDRIGRRTIGYTCRRCDDRERGAI